MLCLLQQHACYRVLFQECLIFRNFRNCLVGSRIGGQHCVSCLVLSIRQEFDKLISALLLLFAIALRHNEHQCLRPRFGLIVIPAKLFKRLNYVEVKVDRVNRRTGIACSSAFDHIVDGVIPVSPVIDTVPLCLHDAIVVDPSAESFPDFYPFRRIDGDCLAVIRKDLRAVCKGCVDQVLGIAAHRLPYSVIAGCFKLICLSYQILPGLDAGRINACVFKCFHTVISDLDSAVPWSCERGIAVDAVCCEICIKVIRIEISICLLEGVKGDQGAFFIQLSCRSCIQKGYIRRCFAGDRCLQVGECLHIVFLLDRCYVVLILGVVKLIDLLVDQIHDIVALGEPELDLDLVA